MNEHPLIDNDESRAWNSYKSSLYRKTAIKQFIQNQNQILEENLKIWNDLIARPNKQLHLETDKMTTTMNVDKLLYG